MNHDFYDSLVYSGKINFLKPKLQQRIQDIFKRIKMHNEFLKLTEEMVTQDEPIPWKSYKYYVWMNDSEKILKKDIKDILEELQSNFNYLKA